MDLEVERTHHNQVVKIGLYFISNRKTKDNIETTLTINGFFAWHTIPALPSVRDSLHKLHTKVALIKTSIVYLDEMNKLTV